MFKAKIWVPVIAIFLIVAILAGYFYLWPKDQGLVDTRNFTKLFINSAFAQDNFEIIPTKADSIGVEDTTSFIITSKDVVDPQALASNISLEPTVDFDFKTIDQNKFEVVPKNPLEQKKVYRVKITSNYLDEAGEEQKYNYSWAFQVKDQFKILNTLPRDKGSYVPVNTGIEITFSHENFIDYEGKIKIEPAIEGRYEKHKRTLVFVPSGGLQNGTIYQVTVDKSIALEGSDLKLNNDHIFRFETEPANTEDGQGNYRRVGFAESFSEFSLDTPPLFPLTAYYNQESKNVPVTVYAFASADQYIEAAKDKERWPYWARYHRDNYYYNPQSLTKVGEHNLPMVEYEYAKYLVLPETLPNGFYLIEMKYDDFVSQAFFQVNNLAIYADITTNNTLIWVNSLDTGGPIAEAQVTSVDKGIIQNTNNDGLATMNTAAGFDQNEDWSRNYHFLKITGGGYTNVVAVSFQMDDYTRPDNWFYFYTDRTMYQPTDKVNFWGFVKPRAGEINAGQELTVKLINGQSYYNYYLERISTAQAQVILTEANTFSGSLDLKNVEPGWYSMEILLGEEVIGTHYLTVERYVKPAYQIEAKPEKNALFAGEDVKVDVKANFFEGTPVANLELKYQASEQPEGQLKTDIFGNGHLSLPTQYQDCPQSGDYYGCDYPQYYSINVNPVKSEEADISAYASVRVFGPKIAGQIKFENEEDSAGRAVSVDILTKVNNVDLDKINNGEATGYQDYLGDPAVNKAISAKITEISYEAKEDGEYYDFINKVVRKKYRYDRIEKQLTTYSGSSNQQGEHRYRLSVEKDKSYRVDVIVSDGQGRNDYLTSYYYNSSYDSRGSYDYYQLRLKSQDKRDNSQFSIGEAVEFEFLKNDELLPTSDQKNYLYFKLKQGLLDYSLSNAPEFSFDFTAQYVPVVYVKGVWFDGRSYHDGSQGNYWWWGGSGGTAVKFKYSDRELKVEVEANKEEFKPGEEVTLQVKVSDLNNNPVAAGVNVNLVDEAYYDISYGGDVNPLETLYNGYISSGEITSYRTNKAESLEALADFGLGAEGGGCFLAGTKVTMADGSTKNIEDIAVGEQIMTFVSPFERKLVATEVEKTFYHVVSGYLIINNQLKVTPEHIVLLNNKWQPIGQAAVGDWLMNDHGQPVKIFSIEQSEEVAEVYNLQTKHYHTYLADGIYVHNQKSGGVRDNFTDNALFASVITDGNGQATVNFTVPDNITSWRITAQAITKDLYAGDGVSKIMVSLPVFVEGTFAKEYLAADQPTVKLRAYGDALRNGDQVRFSLDAATLGLDKTTVDGKAFEPSYINIPQLSLGEYDLTYGVEFGEYQDAVNLPILVTNSHLRKLVEENYILSPELQVKGSSDSATTLTFSDRNRGRLYRYLTHLAWAYGDRVDQKFSRVIGSQLIKDYFSDQTYVPEFEGSLYQYNGGITLLPYSDPEMELSVRTAMVAADKFDQTSLANYFYGKLNNEDSNQEEVVMSLAGLAALDEPILLVLQQFAALPDLTIKEKLYIALGAQSLGDNQLAKSIYLELIEKHGENYGEQYARINTGGDMDDILSVTALAAILAGGLNDKLHEPLWQYTVENRTKEVLINLEKLHYVANTLPNLGEGEVKFTVKVGEQEHQQTLDKGRSWRIKVSPQELASIKFSNIEGEVGLVSTYEKPLAASDATVDRNIAIARKYYVNDVETSSFKESDLVEVRVYPFISSSALQGRYQIIDLLPSGLKVTTRPYYRGAYVDCGYYYPYEIEGQQVKFSISKDWKQSRCAKDYFSYYARITNPGTYQAEPIIIQSFNVPEIMNFADSQQVTIQP